MASFVFKDSDILNTTLLPTESYSVNLSYSVSTTTTRFLGNKLTTITPLGSTYGAKSASIDWREKTFTIGGVTRKTSDLKRRPHGPISLSSTREWRWTGNTYTVKNHDGQWMATPNVTSSEMLISAVFTPVKVHYFRLPDAATLALSPDLPQEDILFLMLVMLYSETNRHERSDPPQGEIPLGMQRR